MIITEYNNKNRRDVIDLIVNIQRNEFDIDITEEQQPDLMDIPSFYQKGKGNFWVAVDGGKVVGTVSLLDIGNNTAALRKMFVCKEYRGKKYSTAKLLLDSLFDWANVCGINKIILGTTAKFHAAHRFYEKHGFLEISTNDLPSEFPIMNVDTKFYQFTF